MITVRLGEEIEAKLNELAISTNKTKSAIIKDALIEHLEDIEDIRDAKKRLNEPNQRYYTTAEVKAEIFAKK